MGLSFFPRTRDRELQSKILWRKWTYRNVDEKSRKVLLEHEIEFFKMSSCKSGENHHHRILCCFLSDDNYSSYTCTSLLSFRPWFSSWKIVKSSYTPPPACISNRCHLPWWWFHFQFHKCNMRVGFWLLSCISFNFMCLSLARIVPVRDKFVF